MTKEQEEAIKNLTSLFNRKARMVQEAKINNAMTNFKIELQKEVNDWETVLSMLKEKDKEIEQKDKIINNMKKMGCPTCEIGERGFIYSGIHKNYIKQYFERKSNEI